MTGAPPDPATYPILGPPDIAEHSRESHVRHPHHRAPRSHRRADVGGDGQTDGMDLESARSLKLELAAFVRELLAVRPRASAVDVPTAGGAPGVALGLAPRPDGGYDVAVRYPLGTSTARMVARRLAAEAGPAVDVRHTGRVRPLVAGPRPPVVTAQAAGETGRVRPLVPGASIGHHAVTAGSIGSFVNVAGASGTHVLSNFHVLAGSPSATVGDAVLQPGPADGGHLPEDRVGALAAFEPIPVGRPARIDAALARLDAGIGTDPTYPVGLLSGTGRPNGSDVVQKIGRTTGVTDGKVIAIELDGVVVAYGPEAGEVVFDDQIEVEGTGPGPFSRGGDSGALVYRPADRLALGLLFAGSERGGENGQGLTYLNPIVDVLDTLAATLV